MTVQELTASLTRAGLEAHARELAALARPAIGIDLRPCAQNSLAIGASRFGGIPDLPDGFEWPVYRKRPLAFLGQIDLSAVPRVKRSALPRSGTLAFFYEVHSMLWAFDPKDRGCARVAYFAPTTPLVRTMPPAKVLDAQAPRAYHHLLGHPQLLQNDMRLECQLATNGVYIGGASKALRKRASRAAVDWELLLQLDENERVGWEWGTSGRIYFWIRKQDLAARRFEKGWLILQCT